MKVPWRRDRLPTPIFLDFPSGSAGKESACNVGDLGLIPGLGRSPGEGKGYPLQYSGLENSMDCIVHGVAKNETWLSDFHFTSGNTTLNHSWKESTYPWSENSPKRGVRNATASLISGFLLSKLWAYPCLNFSFSIFELLILYWGIVINNVVIVSGK